MPPEIWLLPSFLPIHLGSFSASVLLLRFYLLAQPEIVVFDVTANAMCYCRMVYMPMSYLYGKRFVGPITPLILQLRDELHLQPYESINWNQTRRLYAKVWFGHFLIFKFISHESINIPLLFLQEDMYFPHPLVQDLIWDALYLFVEPFLTRWPLNKLVREKALRLAMKHIHYEDENSHYITIGCVEKVKH